MYVYTYMLMCKVLNIYLCHVMSSNWMHHHFGHDAISYHFMDLDPSQHLIQPLST